MGDTESVGQGVGEIGAVWREEISLWASCGMLTGELEVEFKFQRRNCKLSFLFLSQRALLTG